MFGLGKDVVLYSGFFATKGISELKDKCVYAINMIKKCYYWPKRVPGDLIDTQFEDK